MEGVYYSYENNDVHLYVKNHINLNDYIIEHKSSEDVINVNATFNHQYFITKQALSKVLAELH